MILILFSVFSIVTGLHDRTHNSECTSSEVSCSDGECIFRLLWCDGEMDCSDGSDEREGCVPFEGVQADSPVFGNSKHLPEIEHVEAVKKAAKYIISQATDDGWGQFTPRAVVALSFADMVSALTPDEVGMMTKHLKVHLIRDLLEMTLHGTRPSLTSLASYINALVATCQDPRSFEGHDLVALLRSGVDAVISPNFTYPYVLLSLCLADSAKIGDVNTLHSMYERNSRLDFKALVIAAMGCAAHENEDVRRRVEKYAEYFFNESRETAETMDIYSKALYLQAAIASNYSTSSDIARQLESFCYQLESNQRSDGSFGDMLATYSSIPVLLHSSLLDLRCKLPVKKVLPTNKESKRGAEPELVYSLWISSEQGVDARSMIVPFDKGETFLDVMRTAASRNPLFTFLYEETPSGKKVFSLAGIPNEYETARKWTLHAGHPNVTIGDPRYLREITAGIEKIVPKDHEHLIFSFTR